ncbi:MAG: phospho-N-acetylmuramoyl-pentapeptide-transferase [Chitinophagales bacterium]|jgi:phospho-N-acetylmuramoyl-pentapeptide-transferase|nr:phospho-N-acetylmuramoyl-pentapeptide-transferase [Chitinophagales bacterium]
MLYYLFKYLETCCDFIGAGMFDFISFRAGMAIIVSLLISLVFGKTLVKYLQRRQVGETIRDLGLHNQLQKQGTPTMGGLIILAAIIIPTLLFARIENVYVITMLISTVWLGLVGFLDDYIKVFKKDKRGLAGKFKVVGQVVLGIIVGCILYFNEDVMIRREMVNSDLPAGMVTADSSQIEKVSARFVDAKLPVTTIPFVKNHEFNYSKLITWLGEGYEQYTWIIYILLVIFIITAVSNGANMTDGIDGLATGTSAIIGATLGVFAYVSGNILTADYLNIMYIPNSGELLVYCAALIGACVGFLWYNAYPAQVFMGDTGSLALGGIIATLAIIVRKELLIPILCGIFLMENISVMLQVCYFKYTKRKYGEGRRIFKMAPLHHHYQKLGYSEPKIVTRFWIVGILLAVFTMVTLKIR